MTNVRLPKMLEAIGPDGLSRALDTVLEKHSMTEGNYILYKMGGQLSLIQIDFSQKPCQIWYCDSDRRPATSSVLKVIDAFLVKNFGQSVMSGKIFHDLFKLQDKTIAVRATEMGESRGLLGLAEERLQVAFTRLEAIRHSHGLAAAASAHGLFAHQKPVTPSEQKTPGKKL